MFFFGCARNAQTTEALPQITIANAFLGSERRRINSVGLRYGAWVIGVLHPVATATRTTSVHVCRAITAQSVWWNAWCYRCSPLAYIQWRMQASCKRGRAVPRGMAGHGSQGAPQQRSVLLGGRPSRHVRIARRSSPERRNRTPACLHAP